MCYSDVSAIVVNDGLITSMRFACMAFQFVRFAFLLCVRGVIYSDTGTVMFR